MNKFAELYSSTNQYFYSKTLLLGIIMIGTHLAWGQSAANIEFGKGIRYFPKDSSFSVNMHFRTQNLFVYEYDEASESSRSQFLIRRARIKFGGFAFTPKLQYKVELGLSNRDISVSKEDGNGSGASRLILDAVLKWKFSKHWALWIGQTKLPGNVERIISSGSLQFVDRSLLNSRYNIDRDAGLQLRGKYAIGDLILSPALSVSQGEGRNITALNQGGYDYTAYLHLMPLGSFSNKKGHYISSDLGREPKPKLAIGLTYDYNDRAVRQGGQLGNFVKDSTGAYVQNSLSSFFADIMFKYRGFSLMSEYAYKSADKQIEGTSSRFLTGTGFNVQAGYLTTSNIEFAFRYSSLSRDGELSGVKDETQYTLGLSKYMVGHKLKVQSDISRSNFPGTDQGRYQFRMQCEMHF